LKGAVGGGQHELDALVAYGSGLAEASVVARWAVPERLAFEAGRVEAPALEELDVMGRVEAVWKLSIGPERVVMAAVLLESENDRLLRNVHVGNLAADMR
jgi:hypothetical protein